MFALALLVTAAFAAPLYPQRETIDRVIDGVAERSYLVIFNQKAPTFEFQAFEKFKAWLPSMMPLVKVNNVQHVYNINNGGFKGFAVWADSLALRSIMNYEGIEYVEEDQVMRALAFTDRPDWGQVRVTQRNIKDLNTTNAAYNYSGTTYPDAGLPDTTWNWTESVRNNYRLLNTGDRSKIWIVDTGVLQNHTEFADSTGKSRVTTSMDFVTTGGNATDCHGHGSHCAGSAAGRWRGVAVGADIGNVRVLNCQGSGTTANVVAGFNYVSDNQDRTKTANILSASLGGGASQASDDAINNAAANGVVPVVAAGNNNGDACNYSPARAKDAITIGATQSSDVRSTFSNFGTCVDVFAPGNNLHSAWFTTPTSYNTISGTSMATPLVAGALGILGTTLTLPDTLTGPEAKDAIAKFATAGIVGNPGNGSPNRMIYANWG
jgi:subtilisin family serine protease